MAYKMTKEEKETNVLWNQTQEPVLISGYDPALLRKCVAYAEKHPDLCRRVDKHKYPDYADYEIQKGDVSLEKTGLQLTHFVNEKDSFGNTIMKSSPNS